MHSKLSDWNNGWCGLELAVTLSEIDYLIDRLKEMKADPEQHFHITSDYKGEGGLGDIEIYIQTEDQKSNMSISGLALSNGTEIQA